MTHEDIGTHTGLVFTGSGGHSITITPNRRVGYAFAVAHLLVASLLLRHVGVDVGRVTGVVWLVHLSSRTFAANVPLPATGGSVVLLRYLDGADLKRKIFQVSELAPSKSHPQLKAKEVSQHPLVLTITMDRW